MNASAAIAKPSALLAGVAVAAILFGCGGDSGETTQDGPKAAAPTDTAPAKKSPANDRSKSPKQDAVAEAKRQKDASRPKKKAEAEAQDLVRKAAESGAPIPADSPVAREILESLSQSKDGKKTKAKKGKDPVAAAVEEVISGSNDGGGNGSGSSSGSSGVDSVEKILEQIPE